MSRRSVQIFDHTGRPPKETGRNCSQLSPRREVAAAAGVDRGTIRKAAKRPTDFVLVQGRRAGSRLTRRSVRRD
jgi:hypothetical protein